MGVPVLLLAAEPTATQEVAEVHETPKSAPESSPVGTGRLDAVQVVPESVSAEGSLALTGWT